MGEVFRGRDARLKRDVALKVLPLTALGDTDRQARFEREAQVLASLSHPNIAQIFGIEVLGGTSAIVMELVEGSTLADRLNKGALPIDEALSIAAQVCEGLQAAHDRGVIHRDLKPANIKLLPSGVVKILDFGLARVLGDQSPADAANSPTVIAGRTEAGLILGTAAYMSPEQARARPVDKRTDIWAFGCILYEMLSGHQAFAGDSTTDILADVVHKDPDWTRLPPNTPERIVELVQRCLQKNAKERWHDIADVRIEIERASRTLSTRASAPTIAKPAVAERPRLSVGPLIWFAVGAAVAALAMLAFLGGRHETGSAPAVRTSIELPPDTTLALGRGAAIALSPDGRTLVFAGRSKGKAQLYVRALDRFEAQPIAGTDDATNPFFSMDGRWVGFFAEGKLKKVSLDGGAPIALSDVLNPRGEAWGAGDAIFVTTSNNAPVSRVAARGGKPEPVTSLQQGQLSHRWPTLLPDGRTLLFSIWNDAGWEASRIAARADDRKELVSVVEAGGGYPHYIRDEGQQGFLIYARSEGLLATRFDERTLTITGQAVPVVDGVVTNLSGGAHFDLSPSGTLAYLPGALGENERELKWVSLDGVTSTATTIRGLTRTWHLSPDGTKVVRNNANGGGDVWIEELSPSRSSRLTNSPEQGNFNGVWSPDGRMIYYAKGIATSDLYRRPADGRDVEERLTASPHQKVPITVSPDGAWLAYFDVDPVSLTDIWLLDLSKVTPGSAPSSANARPFVKTAAAESYAAFSPDGKWMAYQSNESGRFEIYMRSFPDGERVFRVTADGGISPLWSPDGKDLFYRGLNNQMMAVQVTPGGSFTGGTPRALFNAVTYESNYGISPDGKRFLMMPLIATELSATRVNIVLNFLTELRQRVK
jgi:Tol biopolymer transport system component